MNTPHPGGPPPPDRRKSFWKVVGIVFAVVLAVSGLVLVGLFVYIFVGISQNGLWSNK